MAKSFEEVINDVISRVTESIGTVDTRVGTVLRDAMLAPISSEISNVYTEVETVANNISVDTINSADDAAVDRLAGNFGILRQAGTPASGVVRFYLANMTAGDIVEIPIFTQISSSSYPVVTYKTLSAANLTTASYDTDLQAYYVDVNVLCDQVGTVGNASAGGITVHDLRNVDGVININDFTSGTDQQSSDDLIQAIKATARGNVGTRTGYESLILQNFSISDIKTVTPDDPASIGGFNSGYTDIVILSEQVAMGQDSVVYVSPATATTLIPIFKPMTSVFQIMGTGSTGGVDTPVQLAEGTTGDYEVYIDTSSEYAYGTRSLSRVYLHPRAEIYLKENSFLDFKYYYNDQINTIAQFLEQPDNKVVGANVLVKAGKILNVLVDAKVEIASGFSQDDVISRTSTAVEEYINAFLLGESATASEIIAVIEGVDGVVAVNVPDFKISFESEPTTYVQTLTATLREYLRCPIENVTIQVEV